MTDRKRGVELPQVTCTRCNYTWAPRVPEPRNCPNCSSSYWDRERVYQKRVKQTSFIDPNIPTDCEVR